VAACCVPPAAWDAAAERWTTGEITMNAGLVGGMIGGVIGLLGGVVGTYYSIRNTSGPRERSFMIRAAIAVWIMVTAFLLGVFMLPPPFNFLLWLPYGIALPLGILWCNRRQRRIQAEEAGANATDPHAS
jgi:hypothetical protein